MIEDILFTGTGKKGDNYKFGPVVANSIKIWKTVERRIGGPFKFCNSTPLWHNFNSVDWERVWSNLSLTSKNLTHRLIHFKVIHRAYITPDKRFKMKLQSNFNCHICNTASSGTFLHMFWECPVVISLWTHVNLVLSSLLRID